MLHPVGFETSSFFGFGMMWNICFTVPTGAKLQQQWTKLHCQPNTFCFDYYTNSIKLPVSIWQATCIKNRLSFVMSLKELGHSSLKHCHEKTEPVFKYNVNCQQNLKQSSNYRFKSMGNPIINNLNKVISGKDAHTYLKMH